MGTAASTGFVDEARYVAGPVSDDRQGFLGQGSEDQLAVGAVSGRLQRGEVEHLRIEVVVEDMERPLPFAAFHGNPGTDDLGQPVDVARVLLAAPGSLELLAEGLGPGLGTVDPVSE